ncbi:MAG: OmpA family protein [Flavobacteriaceae bacterium]|nr:OmpA family protein [Flavobacteriaceae bacterium]
MLHTIFKFIFLLFTSIIIAQKSNISQNLYAINLPIDKENYAHNIWGKDTDGDGVKDKKDACPNVPGLKKFNGCPDTDQDGIEDSKDFCPKIAGLKSLKGCPDFDGDGFPDKEDLCPNLFGLEAYNGCPDTDKDGVMDSKDKCPKVAGLIENKGCPRKNKKQNSLEIEDGLEVISDNFKISPRELEMINNIAKGIDFNSGDVSYNQSTLDQLDAIVQIFLKFANAKWSIEGHTDSIGRVDTNLKLSIERANSVRDYLISKGLRPENLIATGFGEKKPIATNMYKDGRAKNRRVEFKLVPSID